MTEAKSANRFFQKPPAATQNMFDICSNVHPDDWHENLLAKNRSLLASRRFSHECFQNPFYARGRRKISAPVYSRYMLTEGDGWNRQLEPTTERHDQEAALLKDIGRSKNSRCFPFPRSDKKPVKSTCSLTTFPLSANIDLLQDINRRNSEPPRRDAMSHMIDDGSCDSSCCGSDPPIELSSVILDLVESDRHADDDVEDGLLSSQRFVKRIETIKCSVFKDKYEIKKLSYEAKVCVSQVEQELFELKHKKNMILRRESELLYVLQETLLQEEYNRLKDEVYFYQKIRPEDKTDDDKRKEEELGKTMIAIVEQRNNMLLDMDIERLREIEEDNELMRENEIKKLEWHKFLSKQQKKPKHDHFTEIELDGRRPFEALRNQMSLRPTSADRNQAPRRKNSDECTIL
ncbi:Uncharacterised protein g5439 [Pycnogonum litorale]